MVGEFHSLKQAGSMAELVERFEELKFYLQLFRKELPEEYFISSFINKLRDDINGATLVVKPKSFEEVVSMARKHEFTTDVIAKRYKQVVKSASNPLPKKFTPNFPKSNNFKGPPGDKSSLKKEGDSKLPARRLLTEAEMAIRKEKNCFIIVTRYLYQANVTRGGGSLGRGNRRDR